MAVYERRYKRYEGPTTPQWSRFWVLPRYVFKKIFSSIFFTIFFGLSFVPVLVLGLVIYIVNSADLMTLAAEIGLIGGLIEIDEGEFSLLMSFQYVLTFFTALFVGPGLVSKDLANNSLPLYLSRPFSRTEYVLGKIVTLAFLMSLLTWGAGLFLFTLQSSFAGLEWAMDNLSLAVAILATSWLWIVTVSLLALALSAWVKWRPVAAFMMLMVLFGGLFFSALISGLFNVEGAGVLFLMTAIHAVWSGLVGQPLEGISPILGWISLLSLSGFSLLLLHLKVRAYEVVS